MNSTEERSTAAAGIFRKGWLGRTRRVAVVLGLALAGVGGTTSCTQLVPATRTLPGYIKRIYVPEFRNRSRDFGSQAGLTLEVADAFMSDGRLEVVQNERADVRLEGTIDTYKEETVVRGSDRFPLVTALSMECTVELWDPYDADRIAPLYRYKVPAVVQYVSDVRHTISETRTEARSRLIGTMAQNIVNAVMTGGPVPLTPIEQRGIDRYRERRGPQNYEPAGIDPRYPDPTAVEDVKL